MNWFIWACLSALFAGLTAVLAKVGVKDVDSDLATAVRTTVILAFAWSIALARSTQPLGAITPGRGSSWSCRGWRPGIRGCATSAP